MISGERLYADFFEFIPPTGFIIVAAWFKAVGESFAATRALALLTWVGIACLIYLTCLRLSRRHFLSSGAALIWVVEAKQAWDPQISHHWFAALLCMAAVWTCFQFVPSPIKVRFSWFPPLIAGLLASAGTLALWTSGGLVALALLLTLLLLNKNFLALLWFLVGCMICGFLALVFVISQASLSAAFSDTIVFSATRYSSIQSLPFAYWANRTDPLRYLYEANLLLFFLTLFADLGKRRSDPVFWSVSALAVAALLGAFPRPDIAHLSFSMPFAIPFTVYCTSVLLDRLPEKVFGLLTVTLIVIYVPSLRRLYNDARASISTNLTHTQRGYVAVSDDASSLIERLDREESGRRLFFYPSMPMLPYLTGRPQVSEYDTLLPYYNTIAQYREACNAVVSSADIVVVDKHWSDQRFLTTIFPAMSSVEPAEKRNFEKMLNSQFTLAWENEQFKILNTTRSTPSRGTAEFACNL